jgi:hypothetical protein
VAVSQAGWKRAGTFHRRLRGIAQASVDVALSTAKKRAFYLRG